MLRLVMAPSDDSVQLFKNISSYLKANKTVTSPRNKKLCVGRHQLFEMLRKQAGDFLETKRYQPDNIGRWLSQGKVKKKDKGEEWEKKEMRDKP